MLSLISSNAVRGEHEIMPRLIQDLIFVLKQKLDKIAAGFFFSRKIGKFQKPILQNWVNKRPSRQKVWLGSSGTSNLWPSIVARLERNTFSTVPGTIFLHSNRTFFEGWLAFGSDLRRFEYYLFFLRFFLTQQRLKKIANTLSCER